MKNKDRLIELIIDSSSKTNEEGCIEAIKELIKKDVISVLVEAHNNTDFEFFFRSPLFLDFWERILFTSPEIKKAVNGFNEKRPNATITLPINFQVTSYDKIMGLVLFIQTFESAQTEEKEAALKIIAKKYNSYYAADSFMNSAFETATLDEKIELIEWFATCTWRNGIAAYEKTALKFSEIADLSGEKYEALVKKMRLYHVISNRILSFSNSSVHENADMSPVKNIQRAYNPRLFQAYQETHPFSEEECQFIEDEIKKYAIHLANISGVRRSCFSHGL